MTLTVTDDDGATDTSATVTIDRRTVFGMNVSPGTSYTNSIRETAADQVNRIIGQYGTLGAAKIFYQGNLPATFNKSYEGLVPGKTVAVCFKPSQSALASGSLDAWITSYIDSIPAGWKVMLVNWQEPDDEMWKDNVFTLRAAPRGHRAPDRRHPRQRGVRRRQRRGLGRLHGLLHRRRPLAGLRRLAPTRRHRLGLLLEQAGHRLEHRPDRGADKMADLTKRIGIKDWGLFETGDNPHLNDIDGSGRAELLDEGLHPCATLSTTTSSTSTPSAPPATTGSSPAPPSVTPRLRCSRPS